MVYKQIVGTLTTPNHHISFMFAHNVPLTYVYTCQHDSLNVVVVEL